jgi:hypothetical protein
MRNDMRHEPPDPSAPTVTPARTTTQDPKRPYHVGVAVGLTTGAYALSLLAATSLQIQHDRALILDRSPVVAAIDALGSHHAVMESRLELARAQYSDGADGYGALITRLDKMRERLAGMDRTVSGIEQASGALAAGIPGAPGSGRAAQGSTSRSSGRGSSGSGSTAPRTVPGAPPPVAAPPTSGSTGASGKP